MRYILVPGPRNEVLREIEQALEPWFLTISLFQLQLHTHTLTHSYTLANVWVYSLILCNMCEHHIASVDLCVCL